MKKILIANRGEIAARVMRTAHAMGYATVAVYSDADALAPHVALADEAVYIGPPAATESYLVIEKIIEACTRTGADAVHPGYGFLSERAEFAAALHYAGITFIGPPAAAIEAMGSKSAAKALMSAAGVPCVPGYHGDEQDDAFLAEQAERVGFPLMIKATAGGGGRGMRLVERMSDFAAALSSARSEAASAFGDDRVLLERAIIDPRHIEIQVFADTLGGAVHLGERDCSVQRRHQKVIEEAPSPVVSEELRARMGAAAVAAARAVGYVGAGTVEFLLGEDGEFYFLEMNTRLQVEHPVTEMITGQDLVAWQLDVAEGLPLPLSQDEISLSGHSIEVRLYAEDPANAFLPQTGELFGWSAPGGPAVRVDAGVETGSVISPYYDPMLAKIIATGSSRAHAVRILRRALEQCATLGATTNRAFLIDCLDHPVFANGDATTGFIPEFMPAWRRPDVHAEHVAVCAALMIFARDEARGGVAGGWSSTGALVSTLSLAIDDERHAVRATLAKGTRRANVVVGDADVVVELLSQDGVRARVRVDGVTRNVFATNDDSTWYLQIDDVEFSAVDTMREPVRARDGADGKVIAPMTGKILAVDVEVDGRVARGDRLFVLEAMKMEHNVVAPVDGVVRELFCSPGDQIDARSILVKIEPDTE